MDWRKDMRNNNGVPSQGAIRRNLPTNRNRIRRSSPNRNLYNQEETYNSRTISTDGHQGSSFQTYNRKFNQTGNNSWNYSSYSVSSTQGEIRRNSQSDKNGGLTRSLQNPFNLDETNNPRTISTYRRQETGPWTPRKFTRHGNNYEHTNSYNANNRRERTRDDRPISFKYIESILQENDPENIILKITKDVEGFKKIINGKPSPDLFVLYVKLLRKICESNFSAMIIVIIQNLITEEFSEQFHKFLYNLSVQSTVEKKRCSYFWDRPHQFWEDVLFVCTKVLELIPSVICHIVFTILRDMKVLIPLIESHHEIHVSDQIKEVAAELLLNSEKIRTKLENKNTKTVVNDERLPPDDFRLMNIYPITSELTENVQPFLRCNIIEGAYRDVEHYLDVQFRLLREDFVGPLRTGVLSYINQSDKRLENIKIHKQVKFIQKEIVNEMNSYRLKYNLKPKIQKQKVKYENSKQFMFGSLVCFTNDDFQTILYGKVARRDEKDLENYEIVVSFDENVPIVCNVNYLMVECKIYFEPYFHVLNVLQNMDIDNFPMEKYIVYAETDPNSPKYLEGRAGFGFPVAKYNLNPAQLEAFKAAITQEFVVIQGPPGTGKTFLGLKVAETLLKNHSYWYKQTPMLVICYTNHALDQFLEGILSYTDKLLRIGGQSKSEGLKQFNISRMRRSKATEDSRKKYLELKRFQQQIGTVKANLDIITNNSSIIDFNLFSMVYPAMKLWLRGKSNEDVLEWLTEEFTHAYVEENIEIDPINNLQNDIAYVPDGNIAEDDDNSDLMDLISDHDMIYGDDEDEELFKTTVQDVKCLTTIEQLEKEIKFTAQSLIQLDAIPEEELTLEQILIWDEKKSNLLKKTKFLSYIKNKLTASPRNKLDLNDIQSPKDIPLNYRWLFYFSLLDIYEIELKNELLKLETKFREEYAAYSDLTKLEDVQIMKRSLVIGMTTTRAASLSTSLQALKSPIVIVEEAAEILESHIICSLTKHCEHLILIGDHQQLKPSASNYKIEKDYKLGISLFERMVTNNIQCHTLNIQHRMRPEISCLITPTIYSFLEDHESVKNRPNIMGIDHCVYFIDHNHEEVVCNETSKINPHEAQFFMKLALHLILNGYKPEQITILAAYLGQTFELMRERQKHSNLLKNVRISCLDNYQGEESDIILLSLVRNNKEKKIGFLKIENRICVALSRARNGLYVMGNMDLLCENSEIWQKIRDTLEQQNAIGTSLQLRCQIHPYEITQVNCKNDFLAIPEGGCRLLCAVKLDCGHSCKKVCHIQDRNHESYDCQEPCTKLLCGDETHICRKRCFEPCGPCTYPKLCDLECGHTVTLQCCDDPKQYECKTIVEVTLLCEHVIKKKCYIPIENCKCTTPCMIRVEPCGHSCSKHCHKFDDPDHIMYKCLKNCSKIRAGCTSEPDESHKCRKRCYEDCEPCLVDVKKFRTVCSHVYTVKCNENVDAIICQKPCTKKLPCGHKCQQKCCDECGPCKFKVDKTIDDCGHNIKTECWMKPTRKDCKSNHCPRLLSCGHKCKNKCASECSTNCSELVDCHIKSDCGHVITKIECNLKAKGIASNDPVLYQFCTAPCQTILKCGHRCSGSCGKCLQNRIHQRCNEKCNATLICNHSCDVPCREVCQPCQKPCPSACVHTKCGRKCGEKCTPCKEPCLRKCKHQRCSNDCGELCSIAPCQEECDKKLKCGHPCVGFCGDPCPPLCRICDNVELTEIFFGNEDDDDARFVYLENCKHVIESTALDKYFSSTGNFENDKKEIQMKRCPKCNETIGINTKRYSDFIKQTMSEIAQIKIQINGSEQENEERRKDLKMIVNGILVRIKNLGVPNLMDAAIFLGQELELTKKRKFFSKILLSQIKGHIQLLEQVVNICLKLQFDWKQHNQSFKQLNLIMFSMNPINHIGVTDQQIDDVQLEILRFERILQFEKISSSANYLANKANPVIAYIFNTLNEKIIKYSHKRYSMELDDFIQSDLQNFNAVLKTNLAITDVERKEIVRALGMRSGHWFKCPNGHLYIITECGGAMVRSKCNECGAEIGGESHRLLPTNSHAREMDGSTHAAWSEAANLANFELDM